MPFRFRPAGPPTTDAERAAIDRAAEALLAVDPTAQRADGDDWIEINASNMQVTVFPREAAVSIRTGAGTSAP